MRSQKLGRRFIFYSLYAWSVPTLIVLFGQIVDNVRVLAKFISQPGFGTLKCWFHSKATFPIQHQNFDFLFVSSAPGSHIIFLYGPMSVFILGNVFFFKMTAKTLCRTRHKDDASLFYSKQKLMQLNKLLEGVIHKFHFSGFVPSLFFSCLWESHG